MIDRRELLGVGAGAAGLSAAPRAAHAAPTGAKPPFVLVHGTWLGGWIWRDVADRLRAQGHRVFTPTLTGVGERHHLAHPGIGLDTHIADIVHAIEWEELSDVVLVTHSFSGVAATGAADRLKDRIRHIVFFDALIPHPGRMTAVETNPDGSETEKFRARRARFIDGYLMDYWADYPIRMLIPDERPDLQALVRRRLTPHPAKAWTDPLVLKNGGWEGLRRTCIRGMAQRFAPSSDKMWGPAREPGWTLIELPVTRMGMLTEPDIVARCLAGIA